MKKHLLLLVSALSSSLSLWAADGDVFIADGLKYTVLSETDLTASLSGYDAITSEALVVPASVSDGTSAYEVTEVAKSAFEDCLTLTAITLPPTVTKIGSSAFWGCEYMTSIDIPASVASIGSYAFSGCSSLTSISLPDAMTKIETSTCNGCTALTSLTIPNSVTEIGQQAFKGCSALTSVNIPESVTKIRAGAFRACSGLTSVTIPNSVAELRQGAFGECDGLTSVTVPESVTIIDGNPFYACSSLTEILVDDGNKDYVAVGGVLYRAGMQELIGVPAAIEGTFDISEQVTKIGSYAFDGCRGLSAVTIPSTVYSISGYAFEDCSGLSTIAIPASVSEIGSYAFSNCSSLTSVELPDAITSIPTYLFYGCSRLTSVALPSSLSRIEQASFNGCSSLASVTIPETVTEIGRQAFRDCSSLKTIYALPSSAPQAASNTFTGTPDDAVIYLPAGAKDSYSTAEGWNRFSDFREMGALTLSLSRSSLALTVGEHQTLEATIEKDAYVTVESESWTTTNPEVATVDGGLITAIGEGSATITCTVVDGYGLTHTATCEVTVTSTTGITNINIEADAAPAEYYTLSGLRVAPDALTPGLYIKHQGHTATKIIIK